MTQDMARINGNDSGLKYKLNQLACIGMVVWMTIPYVRQKAGTYALVIVFLLWFITTEFSWIAKKPSKDIAFVALFFATFVPYLIMGNLGFGRYGIGTLLKAVPLFFLGILVNDYYMHYKKDYNSLGKIALFSLLSYIIGSVQTYRGLLLYPYASRGLAGAVFKENPGLAAVYGNLGIGGFGYIYAACLIFIAVLYFLLKSKPDLNGKHKTVCIVSMLMMALIVYKASFAVSLIITVFGVMLTLFVKNRRSLILITIVAVAILLFIPQELIANMTLKIADLFSDNKVLYRKFTDLAVGFASDSGGFESLARTQLYMASFKTFLKYPLFGVYGNLSGVDDPTSYFVIGGHSGWLDILGFYGLLTAVPLFLAIYFHLKKQVSFFGGNINTGMIIITGIMFTVLGAINPMINIFELGFAQFLIVPSIPFLGYAFMPNSMADKRFDQRTA